MSLLLISGSLRGGSTNTALLRTAHAIDPDTELFEAMGELPHFNPDDDDPDGDLPAPVAALRAATGRAEALLVCTPEYAGALPGAFKNLLEWLVGGAEAYRRPIAWINVSGPAAPNRGADAHESLRKVVGYLSMEIIEDACVRIPVERRDVGEDGVIADPAIREQVATALAALRAGAARIEAL
jgi:NAD(P)H-dependent FMN reductase